MSLFARGVEHAENVGEGHHVAMVPVGPLDRSRPDVKLLLEHSGVFVLQPSEEHCSSRLGARDQGAERRAVLEPRGCLLGAAPAPPVGVDAGVVDLVPALVAHGGAARSIPSPKAEHIGGLEIAMDAPLPHRRLEPQPLGIGPHVGL